MTQKAIKKWFELFKKYHGNNYRQDLGGMVITPDIAVKRRAIRRHMIRLEFMYLNTGLSCERMDYLKQHHETFYNVNKTRIINN